MNNIEILEEFLEQYNASYPEEKTWVAIYPEQIKAIENLIQENKELKTCDGILDVFSLGKESSRQRIEFDYIPKSKVKEKIEEIEKEKCNLTINLCQRNQGKTLQQTLIDNKIEVLQELLEEGE